MTRAAIVRARCVTCRRCVAACDSAAISVDGDSCVVDEALCGGCCACVAVCRTDAISLAPMVRA